VSAKPEVADSSPAPAKSKKMLIIIAALVLVLIVAGVGGYIFISKRNAAAAAEDGEEAPVAHATSHDKPKAPPVYLPLDPMVVNLADPGGEKVAQVGITLEVADAHASDTVKGYLPTIRSSVLLLISQKTAEELLKAEGKEALAAEILKKAAIPFGGGQDEEAEAEPTNGKKKKAKKKVIAEYPVVGVLFSSFIVQ
jgi:flagellar FliL protein